MKNAEGDPNCDKYIRRELEMAKIPFDDSFGSHTREVPSAIIGFLNGWRFRRAWYYWVAETRETPLLFRYADELHAAHGREVRVDGHCGCPAPREWHNQDWHIGVSLYHVDTQEGLNALAEMIKKQAQKESI